MIDAEREPAQVKRTDLIGAAVLVALLVVYAVVALRHLDGLKWDSDEGINVSLAWLVRDGYPLYARVWSDHAPGYVVAMAWAFRAFGTSLTVARGLTLAFGLLGLAAAAMCAREVVLAQGRGDRAAWWGAWVAAGVLGVAPNFWWASRAAMIDIPTLATATLAMACVFTYDRTLRRPWLVASAAAFGLSLWIKYHMVYLAPIMLVLVAWGGRRAEGQTPVELRPAELSLSRWPLSRRPILDIAAWLLIAALPLLLSLVVFDATAMIDQTVRSFSATLAHFPVDTRANADVVVAWLAADNLGLAAMALTGAIAIAARPTRVGAATLVWGVLTIATVLRYAPLYIKVHLEPFLFVLTILGGVAVGNAVFVLGAWSQERATSHLLVHLIGAAGAFYINALGHVLAVDRSLVRARGYDNTGEVIWPGSDDWAKEERREEAIHAGADFLRAHSRPDDFVITDHQIVAFHAGRRLPPEMAVINSRAVDIGLLTPEHFIALTERYEVPAVLIWDGDVATEKYVAWLRQHYDHAADLGNDRWGFVRRVP